MKFLKRPIFIIAIIILAIILAGYFYFFSGKKSGPEFVEVELGKIVQEVSVTGNVKPVRDVDLAFENSGKIVAVLADVGSYVSAGNVIVREDIADLSSQLDKAKADLATQQAELDKQDVILTNDYSSIPNILNDSYTKADDAVRNQADTMFSNPETDNPQLSFSSNDSQAATDSHNGRLASRAELISWKQAISSLDITSQEALYQELGKAQSRLSLIRTFLIRLMDALNQEYGLSSSTANTYKTNVIAARAEVNTASTNITNQIQTIDSQKVTVASDEASIKSYEASIEKIEAQISQRTLRSPIDGIVTKQDAKIGEIAVANATLVTVLSSSYDIDANIPEVDITKIKIGDSARVTLDAYGKDIVFEAKVAAIDPAETMVEGVATYKTTLQFISNDKPVKSGMTANLDILATEKDNVLIIPQRAVTSRNGDKFVNLYNPSAKDGNITEIKVVTGIRGSDGNIEILEGLKEGDKVIISE